MEILTDIIKIDSTEWQTLVHRSHTATWFQTEQAYRFYASLPEIMLPFVVAVRRGEEETSLRGICVGYVTKEKSPLKQFFSRRAIIIGGPMLAEDATAAEVTALMDAVCQQLQSKAIYIETRNFNDYSRWKEAFKNAGFEYQPHLNFHVDTSSREILDANLGKGKKRDIRTTIREGAEIITEPTIEQVKAYYAILSRLYKAKVKTPLFAWTFFENLYRLPSAHFILVGLKGEIIGGTVCVELAGRALYEWFACGEDGLIKAVFPSSYATYAGMCYAADHACPLFDMMGAGKPEEEYGVRIFKAHFGGQLVEHGRFMHICNPLLYKTGTIGVKIMKNLK